MTAIRNVGELASPYFLLEVWVRREEINIDPETFATLKRKARGLVRDARGFELRDDAPDEEWRAKRRDLLALEDSSLLAPADEESVPFDLSVWQGDNGVDAVVVGDLPGFIDPDRRRPDGADPPATAFELALDEYEGDADWGVMLAGLQIRVYRRSSGISQQYLALDLDTLVELDDDAAWKAFAAIFRAPAFAAGSDGVALIRRVVDESRRHASALAADMRRDVVDAAEAIIQGVLNHPDNTSIIGAPTRDVLHRLFEESLYFLYRVLFGMYAESRDILPVSGQGPYATTYSIDHLVELARRGGAGPQGRYYDDSLKALFALLWSGPPEIAGRLGFNPVGGELFDPAKTPTLDKCVIPDPAWERALTSIALGAPDSPRRRLGRRSSFAELGVDQLGSIYEGLLVLEPFLATEDAFLGTYKNERRVFSDHDIEGFKVLRHLHAGDFVLESAGGRRKGSGSFYTPHEITEYLTHAALDPLVDRIVAKAHQNPDDAAHELLDLNVCDPAMGSGAFLVQAARVLALALARVRATKSDGLVTPDRVQHAKREVVRHCLYGVDLNPLAVALAKVSLWLETLEPGRPLSFLDAHLRCGDSLVGVSFRDSRGHFTAAELATFPVNADKGLKTYLDKEAGDFGAPVLERLTKRSKPKGAKQAQLPGIDRSEIEGALEKLAAEREAIAELEERAESLFDASAAREAFQQLEEAEHSVRNRLRRAADFWCAQWFSAGEDAVRDDAGPVVPASVADHEEIVGALVLGNLPREALQAQVDAATEVAQERKFFHWVLEFPEVMLERGGFDLVLGNPPWNALSPDDKEFFSTYDPRGFRKGIPKAQRDKRKAELQKNTDINDRWRRESRLLNEYSNFASPSADRFNWFAESPEIRRSAGAANTYQLFLEVSYKKLRSGGRVGFVLPDAFYSSGPATGLRQRLLLDGLIDFCWVLENRKAIFPIHRSVKVVLLLAQRGDGPTEHFRAAFFTGKDAAGRSRAVSLADLPALLASLDQDGASITRRQLSAYAPDTWAIPELHSSSDSEILLQVCEQLPTIGSENSGWRLHFARSLHSSEAYGDLVERAELVARGGMTRSGTLAIECDGELWFPIIEGRTFYHLELPVEGAEITRYVRAEPLLSREDRKNPDGTSHFDHFRVVWRDVASATNERSAIAAVMPPHCAPWDTALTVWGGSLDPEQVVKLAATFSSFCFDYLHRMGGRGHLKQSTVLASRVPHPDQLEDVLEPAADVICQVDALASLRGQLPSVRESGGKLDAWDVGRRRALIDACVARAYGISLVQLAAILSTFPNIDRSQPMLPGEPKCFVTRDLALSAYCDLTDTREPDLAKLMREIGSGLPDPALEYRDLETRIEAYRELGAVPYRPTPKGARVPIDPSVMDDVKLELSGDPLTAAEIADAVGEDEDLVKRILKDLKKAKEVFSEGRGAKARYYRVEDS